MNIDPRGRIVQQGNIMRIDNAFVENVSVTGNSQGFLIVSYAALQANQNISIQNLRLNINRRTVILNMRGQNVPLSEIRVGMWINAIFSAVMTRSNPPQSNAFLIVIRRSTRPFSDMTTGPIASVDTENGFLYTGNPNDLNSLIRFVITDTTRILNRSGRPIPLSALRPRQRVRITHANFMTTSIPPQTTAYLIQII